MMSPPDKGGFRHAQKLALSRRQRRTLCLPAGGRVSAAEREAAAVDKAAGDSGADSVRAVPVCRAVHLANDTDRHHLRGFADRHWAAAHRLRLRHPLRGTDVFGRAAVVAHQPHQCAECGHCAAGRRLRARQVVSGGVFRESAAAHFEQLRGVRRRGRMRPQPVGEGRGAIHTAEQNVQSGGDAAVQRSRDPAHRHKRHLHCRHRRRQHGDGRCEERRGASQLEGFRHLSGAQPVGDFVLAPSDRPQRTRELV